MRKEENFAFYRVTGKVLWVNSVYDIDMFINNIIYIILK